MLRNTSKFFLYASLASALVVLSATFFPFIGGKYYFFRISIEFSLIFLLLHWAFEAGPGELGSLFRRAVSNPLFIAVSLFAFFYVLASFFAYDPSGAFWSNYERGEGGFQMMHYYIFFVLLTFHFRDWSSWRRAFYLFLSIALLMILYGILANGVLEIPGVNSGADADRLVRFVGPYSSESLPESAWGRLTLARFQGTLGNPAYVAPFLMFSIFYASFLWLSSAEPKKKTGNANWKGWVAFSGLMLVFLFFFVLSQTRGAFLGLGAGGIAYLLSLFFARPQARKAIGGTLAGLLIVGGFLVYYRNTDVVKKIPGTRFLELADVGLGDRTIQTRFWTWNSAWQGFKERPILGWGPENFSITFDKYFDPRHFVPNMNTETWFDRAHNVVFDYLAATGVLGLLSYLGMLAVFYIEFFKRRFLKDPGRHGLSFHQSALLFAMPMGYFVQGLALFDVLPIYINLFFFLALGHYFFYAHEDTR
ncbi:MAG: O-antigen ligase family protein [Candidatus Liptonbacteria bacterium]|nr:O-antigen ligase family protein [Candidatus Liptonbacteria bacterium]